MPHKISEDQLKGFTHEFEIARSTEDNKSLIGKYSADEGVILLYVTNHGITTNCGINIKLAISIYNEE